MLKNLKISTKVFAGFGTILALLAVLSLVGGVSLGSAGGYFTEYREAARQRNALNRVNIALQRVRVNVRNFIIAPKDQVARQTIDRLGQLDRETGEALKVMASRPDLVSQVRIVDAKGKELSTLFSDVVKRQADADKAVKDVIDVAGFQADHELTGLIKTGQRENLIDEMYYGGMALRHLLLARLEARTFLARGDEESFGQAKKNLAELDGFLQKLAKAMEDDRRKARVVKIAESSKTFARGLDDLHTAVQTRNDIFEVRMTALGNDMVKTGDDLTGTLRDFQDALGPKAESAINTA
ncbi:MAG: Tar ligand binding domain-containing protein, partial [Magnetospirillum sp. WYHS-4]